MKETMPCRHCDDTGDVYGPKGDWRGFCECPAGDARFSYEPPQKEVSR
jgi:hypothetical protein